MAKFRKLPVVIEAITFDELVKHGLENGANVVSDMPWSWDYNGHTITHENDKCYLIPTAEGVMNMTPDDMLITGVKGEIYPCKIDIFKKTYIKDHEGEYSEISIRHYPSEKDKEGCVQVFGEMDVITAIGALEVQLVNLKRKASGGI